ncbi:outer membrane beta-barrel protein [Spirosoma sp. HMF4905]|uniref:Outer membrane beta-barrel protein n=1 Tax=Spirosoma arboris TaxID=2682092 RepID=A0A7K1SGK0_9BACT|nr:porin [Spirosoma arboris]MVM32706.1 outer membrane beta-barrel protein [Spirosoma arboris]
MKKAILLINCLFLGFAAQAQDSTSATPGKFTFSGYMDTYYFGNFNNPKSQSNLGLNGSGVGNARAFDQKAGQFGIGLIQAKAVYSASKVDAVMDLTFGTFADLGNYGNNVGLLGTPGSTALAIKQAYIVFKATDKLSFTAGQFGTHIGYEVIDAPLNYNYSLSNLFNNGPFYHIGLKAQYAFSDKASLMVGLVNNVDNLVDNNKKKGLIGQFFFSPVSGWNVYLNAIVSNEASQDVTSGTTTVKADDANYQLFDLTTTYQITPKFFLGLNAASGSQKGDYQGVGGPVTSKSWGGVAGYANYAFTDKFGLGVRYETFDNKNGARALTDAAGNGASVNSITVTGNITAADGHVLLKPELRIDSYSANKFEKNDGSLTTSQATLGMAAIFKF